MTFHIPQSVVGQVNVVGDCYCFGLSIDPRSTSTIPVYLDIAGPATSVEAAWAKLNQGKELVVVRDQGSLYLQTGEKGAFKRFQRKIPGLSIDHLLLIHRTL